MDTESPEIVQARKHLSSFEKRMMDDDSIHFKEHVGWVKPIGLLRKRMIFAAYDELPPRENTGRGVLFHC